MRYLPLFLVAALFLLPRTALAHCDALDGPVVTSARNALAAGDVSLVLPWVPETSEAEMKEAFQQTVAVRRLNATAQDLADRYFFETVVRLHRAGEGEPYTGLKPAGREVSPAIAAADRAIEHGSLAELVAVVTAATSNGIRERYEAVVHAKHMATPGNVAAGRRFVAAYVSFIHYVERLFEPGEASEHAEH